MNDKMHDSGKIRQFDSGATRDTDVTKPNYVKALSPIVLQRYVDYIGRHRLQSDGNLRDWDNWKNGMPQEVYLDGLGRHFWAVWLLFQGFSASDNHGPVTLEDSLCAIIFNAQGMLHELLKKKNKLFVCPAGWVIRLVESLDGSNSCGWIVDNTGPDQRLWKNLTLNEYTGWDNHKFGEAPGYWPTKEDAEAALAAYLVKEDN